MTPESSSSLNPYDFSEVSLAQLQHGVDTRAHTHLKRHFHMHRPIISCIQICEPKLNLELPQHPEDQTHAKRFVYPAIRFRFSVGRSLLRWVLNACVDESQPWRLRYTAHGQPEVVGLPEKCGITVSHGGTFWVVGVLKNGDVGVDIEAIARFKRTQTEHAQLARFALSPLEQAQFIQLDPPDRERFIAERWTLKEAISKALGLGLRYPFRQATLTGEQPHWRWHGPHSDGRWTLASSTLREHRLSVAWRTSQL